MVEPGGDTSVAELGGRNRVERYYCGAESGWKSKGATVLWKLRNCRASEKPPRCEDEEEELWMVDLWAVVNASRSSVGVRVLAFG